MSQKQDFNDLDQIDREIEQINNYKIRGDENPEEISFVEDSKTSSKSDAISSSLEELKTGKNSRNNRNFRNQREGNLYDVAYVFPELKFYLPTLREGYTRYIPIGGNNETGGKNMCAFQYEEDLLLVDGGLMFPNEEMLGADYSIPDVSFLRKYTKNIKGMIVTHAHLDHIGGLKHILPALDFPVIYATKLTIGLIKKSFEEHGLNEKTTFIEVDATKTNLVNIGKFKVEFFSVNHSVPDCAGLYIESPGGAKFLHTGDFKFEMAPKIDKPSDISRYEKLGKRGITMMFSDSTGSNKKGFSMSESIVGETLEKIISEHREGRLIITIFASWISRVQQIIDICSKYEKSIFLSGRSMNENIAVAKELGYLTFRNDVVKKITTKNVADTPDNKQVILTTGSQGEEASGLYRMSEGKHPNIEIRKGDTVVFSSSVIPGNEKSVGTIINKLIKMGSKVITKDDDTVHTGGHGNIEDQKQMYNLVKPRYFCPVHGDLYFRHLHAKNVIAEGMKEENIVMLENGNIVDFAPNGNIFKSKIQVPLSEIVVDGKGIGTAGSHVIKARQTMAGSGVLVINFKVDSRTKTIMGNLRIESRGLLYLDESRKYHRIIAKKARDIYEMTLRDVPDIEEKELIKLIKTDLESFVLKILDREPMIIPMIVTL